MIATCGVCGSVSSEVSARVYYLISYSDNPTIWNGDTPEVIVCGKCIERWLKDNIDSVVVMYRILDPIEVGS